MGKFYICVVKIYSLTIRLISYEISNSSYFFLFCFLHPAG